MTIIMRGSEVARSVYERLDERVARLAGRGIVPGLAAIIIGGDHRSELYVRKKQDACHAHGIASRRVQLPDTVDIRHVLSHIDELNHDPYTHAILVQLPLPPSLKQYKNLIIDSIEPSKEVDGLHREHVLALERKQEGIRPCTPRGVLRMLDHYGVPLEGRDVVVIGRSRMVGRPLARMLQYLDATVTLCHKKTNDLARYTRDADILISAAGKAGLVSADMIKEGAVVVDVGINRVPHPTKEGKTKLVGDVNYGGVKERASHITPVPGGVGPMTLASLLENTVQLAEKQHFITK